MSKGWVILLLVVLAFLAWRGLSGRPPREREPLLLPPIQSEAKPKGTDGIQTGADSDASTHQPATTPQPPSAARRKPHNPDPTEGSPPIDLANNPGAKAAADALKSGAHPERLSVAFKPKPFSKAAFAANPQAYLDLVEPGRVWDVAEPGPGVKDLEPVGNPVFNLKPLGSLKLTVQAEPNAPVTFTTFDYGVFDNQMTSITVRADEKGLAQATYTAVKGTTGDVDILAASPLSAGQVNFKVSITK